MTPAKEEFAGRPVAKNARPAPVSASVDRATAVATIRASVGTALGAPDVTGPSRHAASEGSQVQAAPQSNKPSAGIAALNAAGRLAVPWARQKASVARAMTASASVVATIAVRVSDVGIGHTLAIE